MTRAVLSLGSNLGDRAGHLRAAMAGLAEYVMAVSGVYETPAWGEPGPDGQDSPPYTTSSFTGSHVTLRPRLCDSTDITIVAASSNARSS